MTGLLLEGVIARRGRFILGPIDLEVPTGTATAVLGPSGAGKTTLLRAVAGFLPLTAGRISLDNRRIDPEPPERRRLGFVPPNLGLFPHLSVRRNVTYPLRLTGREDADERGAHWLSRFDLEPLADRFPTSLSSGERQRVAMARALAAEPGALLWDEPLSALDVESRDGLLRLLRELIETEGIPLVLITHDPGTAAALASHYVVVADGRVRFAGDPVAFASAPLDRFTARFLGYENLFSRQELEAARAMPIGRSLLDAAGPDGVVVPSSALRWTPARGGAGQVTALRATPGGWLVALHTGPLTFHALVSRPLPGVKVGDAVDLALEEREVRPLHGGSEPP